MLKKSITFRNFDDEEVTEIWYFHLSQADLAKMAMVDGGMEKRILRLAELKDHAKIIEEFEKIVRMSVGRRSEDGKEFIRSKEIADKFMSSEAYSKFFIDIFSDTNACVEFFRGMVPSNMKGDMEAKLLKVVDEATGNVIEDNRPAWEKEDRDPTVDEMASMTAGDLQKALTRTLERELEKQTPVQEVEDNRPAWEKEDRNPTKSELMSMSPDEMKRAFLMRANKANK